MSAQSVMYVLDNLNKMLSTGKYNDISYVYTVTAKSLFKPDINNEDPCYTLFFSIKGVGRSELKIVPNYEKNPELTGDDDIEPCQFISLKKAVEARDCFIKMMKKEFSDNYKDMEVLIFNIYTNF